MKKLHNGWIVLIVFCSVIILGGIFYLFYRLYINHIYKRKRFWNEITLLSKNKSEEKINDNITFLMPRESIMPLVQEFLPKELKKQSKQRKMVTQLQFNDPPLVANNFKEEWDEMDTKSLFSLQLISNHSSYHTIREQISRQESIEKYFSINSSTEQLSSTLNSQNQSFINSSNHEKTISPKYIVLNIREFQKINLSNNFSTYRLYQ